MKYTDIHNNLPEKELREFFTRKIAATNFNMYKVKKKVVPYDNGREPFVWAIQNAEAELECKITELDFLRKKRSLYVLMRDKGWFSHDVSDFITKNMEFECWMDFIGTKAEYETLLVILEAERNAENTK